MESYKERLIEEQKQLKEKLLKLLDFMNSEKYYSFDDSTKAVFNRQRTGMELYLSALNIRIFGDTKAYNAAGDMMSLLLMSMFTSSPFSTSKTPEMEKLDKMIKEIEVKSEDKGKGLEDCK